MLEKKLKLRTNPLFYHCVIIFFFKYYFIFLFLNFQFITFKRSNKSFFFFACSICQKNINLKNLSTIRDIRRSQKKKKKSNEMHSDSRDKKYFQFLYAFFFSFLQKLFISENYGFNQNN